MLLAIYLNDWCGPSSSCGARLAQLAATDPRLERFAPAERARRAQARLDELPSHQDRAVRAAFGAGVPSGA